MASRPENMAAEMLAQYGIHEAPVDVERLVKLCGITVVPQPFDDGDVSGMLLREDGRPPVIGVNTRHARVRQRFTIAHEAGHWALHPGREVIFDRPMRINHRDSVSAMATDREEIQANAFAAALLMPERLVREHARQLPTKTAQDPDAAAAALARDTFHVSHLAMSFRLINLGLAS